MLGFVKQSSSPLKTHLRRQIFQATKLTGSSNNQDPFQFVVENKTQTPSFVRGANVRAHSTVDMATASGSGTGSRSGKPNRLAQEKSPYLLQHAYNPVDWFPWGPEAFEKAKLENKPIFLSVGYSTCHWCHVMERESFESDVVANVLNQHYIPIKVDREERPDVDRIYMSFVQRTTGGGGWPMSVFLTPELEPLYGGTYFPPQDMYGRVGFRHLLEIIAKQWREEHQTLREEAKAALLQLKVAVETKLAKSTDIPREQAWDKCFQQLSSSYEEKNGGFSQAPKFPQPSMFNFLFHMYSMNKKLYEGRRSLQMCLHTLKRMAYGGIHDHVNCGFARYSVDAFWRLPHFEKMLYDQAQLTVSYVDAYLVSKDPFYAEIVDDILTYVSRDLGNPEGGFYGAEDADSYPKEGDTKKVEGAFCAWEFEELKSLLTGETNQVSHFELYSHHFGIKVGGNIPAKYDGHGELTGKNVLSCAGSVEETALNFGLTDQQTKEILELCNDILYKRRQSRPKPSVDDKIVTAWNGLMISGFAKAGFVLKKQKYTDRAVKAAKFIQEHLYKADKLLRCCYGSQNGITHLDKPISGFLDDYAFLIRGLLDLYEATMDASWLQWAETLQGCQNSEFWDAQGHGYFNSAAGDTSIIVRDKEEQDGAEPCGNSVSVHNLLRLAAYLDRKDLRVKAGMILGAYSQRLLHVPIALPEMTSALMFYHSEPTQVFIAGSAKDDDTQALLDVVRTRFLPGRILALADGPQGGAGLLYSRHESLARLKPVNGKSAAYVCRNFACSLPVTDPKELATSLDAESKRTRRPSDHSDSDSDL